MDIIRNHMRLTDGLSQTKSLSHFSVEEGFVVIFNSRQVFTILRTFIQTTMHTHVKKTAIVSLGT